MKTVSVYDSRFAAQGLHFADFSVVIYPSPIKCFLVTCRIFHAPPRIQKDSFMLWRIFKKIVFWSYGRTSWQYDVLCALILAFVFLTPKSWFERGKLACAPAHQNGLEAAQKLLRIRATGTTDAARPGAQDIERCARNITEQPGLRVKGWRELKSTDGRTVAYEVDIEP